MLPHLFGIVSPFASVVAAAVTAPGIQLLGGHEVGRRYRERQWWCSCEWWADIMATAMWTMVAVEGFPDGGQLESRRGAEYDISGRHGPGPSWSVANKYEIGMAEHR